MIENLVLGLLTMGVCLGIQCVAISAMLRVLIRLEQRGMIRPTLLGTSGLLVLVMTVMLTGNLIQMVLWAGLFWNCGEFDDIATAFYHSVVNFSTLGYGDVVMSAERRLLGALEATNGVLMFGLTTGVLFSVLNDTADRAWHARTGRPRECDSSE